MRWEESPWNQEGMTAAWWKSLNSDQRTIVLESMSDEEVEDFFYDWRVWGRPEQLPPELGTWRTWLIKTGRGWGKTRTAVEAINEWIRLGYSRSIAIIGQGDDDIRRVMIEGKSGFLRTARPSERPRWSPSVNGGQLVWPCGAVALVFSAEDPEGLRGPEYDTAWFDEPMAVPAKKRAETISNMRFGLRLMQNGVEPRLIYTTTPKKHPWMKMMLEDVKNPAKKIFLTEGSTYENEENLAPAFIEGIREDYEGTRLGKQEVHGMLLGDEEGALWTSEGLDETRLPKALPLDVAARCDKVVVGVDPNIKTDGTAHAAGVVVVGRKGKERFVLADKTKAGGPSTWARAAVEAAIEFEADEIVAESNQGGEMVRLVILQVADDMGISIRVHLIHSRRGKTRRAEPAAALYDRKLVHHVGHAAELDTLETQMTALHDGDDPTGEDFDRVDALIHGLTRLGLKAAASIAGAGPGMMTFGDFQAHGSTH